MKIAKAIESPVYSKRTEVEINEQMRTNLISTNLGLDIPGTLMKMDNNGICHIQIDHSDPSYISKAIKHINQLYTKIPFNRPIHNTGLDFLF